MVANGKLGPGIKHLVLGVPGAKLRADGVPSQFVYLDPVFSVHHGRLLGFLDQASGLFSSEIDGP